MKIYTIVANENSMIVRDGFPIAERFRKDKETGEKKFYPVGTYNLDKSRTQYFFLGKSFHELISENNLKRIDYMVFREHNNIPGLKIAFPNKKETSAFLVFDGYRRDQVTFVDSKESTTLACPYCHRPSAKYEYNASTNKIHCSYCKAAGVIARNEEQAVEMAEEFHLESSIKIKGLIDKFFHIDYGSISIFKPDQSIQVEEFLDTFAVVIPDGATIRFLLTRMDKHPAAEDAEIERQYFVEFTHRFDNKPAINITLMHERGMTLEQYQDLEKAAIDAEDMLKHSISEGTDTIFFFPDKEVDSDSSPFQSLRDVQFTEHDDDAEDE